MKRIFSIIILIFTVSVLASAQTTAFNFQGRLNDGASPANGRYDLEFRLYDALTGDNIIGTAISKPNLTLINGVFSTQLDFGLTAFNGADRFIEIRLRQTATGSNPPNAFVILGPRQQILAVPYTVRSSRATLADDATHAVNADNATNAVNAQQLGNVAATNYLQKNGNGSQLTNVNAAQLDGVAASQYVQQGNLGTVKAMLEVNANGSILKCFNATLTGGVTTTPPCGVNVNRYTNGGYGIKFNFIMADRFIAVTPYQVNTTEFCAPNPPNPFPLCQVKTGGAYYEFDEVTDAYSVNVHTFNEGSAVDTANRRFMLIVY